MGEVDEVGAKLRIALGWKLQDAGIDWPLELDWDEERVRARLRRGELVLNGHWTREPPWWRTPSITRDELAELLIAKHRQYADADPDGYRLTEVEIDGFPELLQMGPGVRECGSGGDGVDGFARLDFHRVFRLPEALEAGWVRLL